MKQLFTIKITETAFDTYTGEMCDIDFVDGLSTRPLTENEVGKISSVLRVELIPSDIVTSDDPVTSDTSDTLGEVGDTTTDGEITTETTDGETTTETTDEDIKKVADNSVFKYTRQELEALADAQGISGLREVANQYGIKGKTINDIMEKLLQVQQ